MPKKFLSDDVASVKIVPVSLVDRELIYTEPTRDVLKVQLKALPCQDFVDVGMIPWLTLSRSHAHHNFSVRLGEWARQPSHIQCSPTAQDALEEGLSAEPLHPSLRAAYQAALQASGVCVGGGHMPAFIMHIRL